MCVKFNTVSGLLENSWSDASQYLSELFMLRTEADCSREKLTSHMRLHECVAPKKNGCIVRRPCLLDISLQEKDISFGMQTEECKAFLSN